MIKSRVCSRLSEVRCKRPGLMSLDHNWQQHHWTVPDFSCPIGPDLLFVGCRCERDGVMEASKEPFAVALHVDASETEGSA